MFRFLKRRRSRLPHVRAALVLVALAAVSGAALAQEPPNDDEAAIRALIGRYYAAYATADLAAVRSLWSARVPGLDRLMTAFEPTIKGRDFVFANLVVSKIELKSVIASARAVLDATVVDTGSKAAARERWVRNFTLVKDPEGWRVWRDASAAEDVAIQIGGAKSADGAAAIVEREPDVMSGEVSQALFSLGNRFRAAGRAEEALAVYRLSEQVAIRSNRLDVIAASYTNMGVASQLGGQYDRALESFEKARALYGTLGDQPHIARSEANIGSALYLKQRYAEAADHYRMALPLFEQVGDAASAAGTLHSIGNALYLASDYDAAIESYRRSLALHESLGNAIGAANALQAIGLVQKEQGDYDAALESYAGSLARHEKYGNKPGIGIIQASLGDVHRLMGHDAQALECYFAALPLLEEMDDKITLASTFSDIGGVYAAERRYPQALEYLARSLVLHEATRSTEDIARVVASTGAVYFAQAKYAPAMEQYERCLRLFQEIDSRAGIAWTLVHMGLVHQAEGRFADAQAAYEKGLAIAEALKDRPSTAIALALMARVRAALDRPHEALAVARQAAATASESGELDTLARARLVAGEIGAELEDPASAREAFVDAVGAVERLQTQGALAERGRFFGDTLAPFLGLVRLSLAEKKPEEALAWLERGKAYLLRAVIGGTGTLVTKGMTDAERADERALARRMVSLTTQLKRERGREAPDQARVERLQADLDKTRSDQAAFTKTLNEAHPLLKTLRGQGAPLAIGGAADLRLPASSAVLEFAVGEKATFVFVVKSDGAPVKVLTLAVRAPDLAAKIAQFRSLILKKDAGADRLGRELYDLLLKPAEGEIGGATALVVVPDAVLWALPFQALQPRDNRYLIEDRAVSYAPSLAAFVEMTGAQRQDARDAAALPTAATLGVALPARAAANEMAHLRPDVKIEAVPEAPKEAAAVAGFYGAARGKALVGDSATTAAFARDAPTRDALHLALPGVLNDSSPMTSRLAFAPAKGDDKDDGLVEMRQLMGVDLKARFVFFSRLQGEPGQSRAGDAAVGAAWSVFVAGTATTVLSSWVVDAPSTAALSLTFHRRMAAGGLAADALRRAILGLLAAPATRPPYYWAGFSVFGR